MKVTMSPIKRMFKEVLIVEMTKQPKLQAANLANS